MGNVFCSFSSLKTIDVQPVFHLSAKSGVIKDLSCFNTQISNYGVVIASDAQEGQCCNFANGYIDTKFLNIFKNLWGGEFSIKTRIQINSIPSASFLFGSCRATDTNGPGTITVEHPKKINLRNSTDWYNPMSTNELKAGVWTTISIVAKNKKIFIFIDDALKASGDMSGNIRDYPLFIGAQTAANGMGVSSSRIDALISYFKIFNTAIK